jgi:signal transduction histidine kinase
LALDFPNLAENLFSAALHRVEDPLERKRVSIAINLALAQIAIYVGLFLFATLSGYNPETTYYTLISAGMIALMIVMTQRGYPKFGMGFGLVLSCISIIFIAKRAGVSSGVDHFYVLLGVVPFVFFGYKDRHLAISLLGLASICFLITRSVPLDFIKPLSITTEQSRTFLFINTILVSFLTAYALMELLAINQMAERELIRKQVITERQNDELRKLNHELDQFVYSASHDLVAPLKSIRGLLQLGELETPPLTATQINTMIRISVGKHEEFIHEITDYSRNSRMPVNHDAVDLASLIDSIWNDHRYYRNQESRIHLYQDVDPSATFFLDKTRLRIIFSNLISNAIKFHLEEQHGQPFIKVVARAYEREYEFTVEDNGRGMSNEIQQCIFDMFFKGDTGATGSGLGLYILKESVAKLGGHVAVDSEFGRGSKFTILIPKPAPALSYAPEPAGQSVAVVT